MFLITIEMVLNYLHKDCKFYKFQGESLVLMLSCQISLFFSVQYIIQITAYKLTSALQIFVLALIIYTQCKIEDYKLINGWQMITNKGFIKIKVCEFNHNIITSILHNCLIRKQGWQIPISKLDSDFFLFEYWCEFKIELK